MPLDDCVPLKSMRRPREAGSGEIPLVILTGISGWKVSTVQLLPSQRAVVASYEFKK
jgi:hypothetical protein